MNELTSLDVHLSEHKGVFETDSLTDNCAGHQPCYFMRVSGKLLVASSVVSLIAETQSFERNHNFQCRDFLGDHFDRVKLSRRAINRVKRFLKIRNAKRPDPFYPTYGTIDKRIRKLGAFESVCSNDSRFELEFDCTITDEDAIIERSANYITKFVNKIEQRFPDYQHIVLTGGKDSQLVVLTPKLFPENWSIFSAEPNYRDVLKWLADNAISVKNVFRHDNQNEETPEETELKIVASDLYSDPMHLRWLPALKQIAADFDNKCIFWGGTISSRSHFYAGQHVKDWGEDKMTFFLNHFNRAAHWQGNYHQVVKNVTGRPYLSPFYSEEIWRELYQHIDPEIYLKRRIDLRDRLGEMLAGRPVLWLKDNKGPERYEYPNYVNGRKIYLRHIRNVLGQSGGESEGIGVTPRFSDSPIAAKYLEVK